MFPKIHEAFGAIRVGQALQLSHALPTTQFRWLSDLIRQLSKRWLQKHLRLLPWPWDQFDLKRSGLVQDFSGRDHGDNAPMMCAGDVKGKRHV